MANDFASGVMAGEEQKKSNPFNLILGRFQEAQARRYKEDSERKKEEAELSKALQVLSYQKTYEGELQKAKAEEDRKTGLFESVRKGEVTQTEETGVGTFEGTPFGVVGQRFKKSGLSKEEKTAQNQDLSRATQLRKEFIDRPEVKEFVAIRNKATSMDALLKNAVKGDKQNKVALDQGLITLFNKITDPNSVVRESEYARTPQNLPLANRFSGAIQKLQKGGAGLTDDDRKSLVWGAKVIVNEQGKMFNEKIDQYSKIATDYGVEPNLITSGITPHKDYSFDETQQSNDPEYLKYLQSIGQ